MNRVPADNEETYLFTIAGAFPYPPAPDLSLAVRRRLVERTRPRRYSRLAWATAALIIILAALLAVPPVRAQLVEWLQIGAVRIFLGEATPTLEPAASTAPTPTLLPSLLDLDGETSLESARQAVGFPILLPSYPADLGLPDHVFLHEYDSPLLFLVWGDHQLPGEVRLTLQILTPGSIAAEKWQPDSILDTRVNEKPAAWVAGPYLLRLRNGDLEMRRMVEGNVLVWEQDGLTYRLESTLPVEEAVKIAESLK